MEVIGGATLVATDANWDVYRESIYFDIQGNFEGNITNGDNNPVASGTYEYQKIDADSASLSYVEASTGFSFSYDLTFTGHGFGSYRQRSQLWFRG